MKTLFLMMPVLASLSASAFASDVTVIQAWTNGDQVTTSPQSGPTNPTGPKTIHLGTCTGSDCAVSVAKVEMAPLATSFVYTPNYANCEVVEIRTLTLKSAYNAPGFAGIGFSYNDTTCGTAPQAQKGVFVPKDQLAQVGQEVTTVDGQPALLHRFVAQGYCSVNTQNSSGFNSYGDQFKPYAQYNRGNQSISNWDTSGDFALGCTSVAPAQITSSLDRANILLKK